jgi:MFS family permease
LSSAPEPARHDPLAALRERSLRLFVTARLFYGAALTLFRATIAWHVFDITGSAFHLGLIGVVQFIPALALSLVGGAVADAYDRRKVVLLCQVVPLLASLVLFTTTESGAVGLVLIYSCVLLVASASAFEAPAGAALLPLLVPREIFANAVTVNSTARAFGFVLGPAVGGFLIAAAGVGAAYALHAGFVIVSVALLSAVRPGPQERDHRAVTLHAIREGLSFLARRQVLLGSMALDMFAVILGSVTALLPIYANEILGVGARGYGILSASLEFGALVMSLVLILLPPIERAGGALLGSVAVYGMATLVFALSRSFPLTVAAYILVGMADQVSVVMRGTILQLATPDALRGRVSSVNMIFIGASNQLGAARAGFVAAATSVTFAAASGALGCLAILGVLAVKLPELRRYRIVRGASCDSGNV